MLVVKKSHSGHVLGRNSEMVRKLINHSCFGMLLSVLILIGFGSVTLADQSEVAKTSSHYTLTDRGRPKAVIMSAEEFESWAETLEVMRDMPDLEKDIEQAEKDLKTGAYKNYSTLDEILEEEGYVKVGKKVKKQDVSDKILSKSKKRTKKNYR